MRLIICGGRDFTDAKSANEFISKITNHAWMKPLTIIHGGAKGADAIAGAWAAANGCKCEVYKADWAGQGRAAGPIRNRRMIAEGKPDAVIALPGGRGTQDMVKQAFAAGLVVHSFKNTDFVGASPAASNRKGAAE
jgi:hypothetical protein